MVDTSPPPARDGARGFTREALPPMALDLAARGLLHRLEELAAATPGGRAVAVPSDELATLVPTSPRRLFKLLAVLERAGVLVRERERFEVTRLVLPHLPGR